ncbi:MAG: VWA domain-containing protein, partial [Thioalkalivibrio sp.]|nr:VWA domain-containing protein [Thioalkalivibrio sp.]
MLALFSPQALARTVLLVYDDSGSMVEDGVRYHEFANYATQNMAALLAPGDRLEVVRLSQPEQVVTLLPEQSTDEVIDTVASWVAAGSTPYIAVQTAMARLRELARDQPRSDDESYWLIVFSDGAFDSFRDDVQEGIDTVPGDVAALRRDFADRRFGIVYLGIGTRADTYAEPWRRAGVLSLTAPDAPAVAEALFDIAAVITERDPAGQGLDEGLTASPGNRPGTVAVETELPLARLATFYQSERPLEHGFDAADSSLRTTDGERVDLQARGPYDTAGGGLYGVVNVIEADEAFRVLRPGTFQLALSGPGAVDVDPARLRVLPEVALDLVVTAEVPGVVCAGEPVPLIATLEAPDRSTPVPLGSLRGLRIEATVNAPDGPAQQVSFDV